MARMKRSARTPIHAAKRAATEKALLAAQELAREVEEQDNEVIASSSSAPRIVVEQAQAEVPQQLRTILLIVTFPDETRIHKVVERPDWLPEDFERVWKCKHDFFPGHKNKSEWLSLVRVLYGQETGDEKHNPLFGVKDMAERKRILADDELCTKFFAEKNDKLQYFDVATMDEHPYEEPINGPMRVIMIGFD
jgi:hypothetical protein